MKHSTDTSTPLRPSAGVYSTIREMAIEYRFRPDQKINEVELAKTLGVSRTPVREALNRLLNEGLIQFQKNHGFFSRSLSASDLFYLAETRSNIEINMLVQVIERASDDEIAQLKQFCRNNLQNLRVMAPCELARADEAYHGTLASLTHNPVIEEFLRNVNARLRFMRKIRIEDPDVRDTVFQQHLNLVNAVEQRDLNAARKLMTLHLAFSEQDAGDVITRGLPKIFRDKIDMDVNLTT